MNPIILAEGSTAVTFLDDAMKGVITSAFNGIGTDVVSIAKIGLPVALGITGLFFAVRLGIGFFKTVAH